ncbi:hypothetical protein B4133_1288 [Bacillus altitudinis]|nr:hypothetical protein B4133_1288 [Bacillus altitudinis]
MLVECDTKSLEVSSAIVIHSVSFFSTVVAETVAGNIVLAKNMEQNNNVLLFFIM